MTSRPDVPAICPSASSVVRSAASHPPGPLGQVPRPHRYYQPTPISRLPSRLASSPSLGTTTASPLFAPPGRDDSPRTWTTSTAAPAPPLIGGGKRDLPGSWTTLAYMLRSPTPADHRPPGHYRTGDGVFRTGYYVDSTMMVISGLNHAACTLPVYASRPRSPQDAQHSVPAGASLDRAGLSPAGSHRRFLPCLSLYMASPFTKLCLAHIRVNSRETFSIKTLRTVGTLIQSSAELFQRAASLRVGLEVPTPSGEAHLKIIDARIPGLDGHLGKTAYRRKGWTMDDSSH